MVAHRLIDIVPRHAEKEVEMIAGIDCHKDSLAVCLVDELGRPYATGVFKNAPDGHRELLSWAKRQGPVARFGIEGSGAYGACLAEVIARSGEATVEVPANLTARERRRLRQRGKSDPADALAIARVAARERHLPPIRAQGVVMDLKLLCDYRDQLVAERTRATNRLHQDLVVLAPGYHRRCAGLKLKRLLAVAESLLSGDGTVRGELAQRRIDQLRRLDAEVTELERRITHMVRRHGTSLTAICGVGPLVAARIVGEVGDVRRFPTRNHFASANGTAPIPASSGRVQRHRLNRGGNRQLNRAIHVIALTQSRIDPRARAYMNRRRAEGKSWQEALRCLKRHLSDVVYAHLQGDFAEGLIAA
jgi:transposase